MEIRKKILELEHPNTLTSIANLTSTFSYQDQWKEAKELQVQVMKISLRVLELEHLSTQICITNLASTYQNQER